jgi:hypothetical protein
VHLGTAYLLPDYMCRLSYIGRYRNAQKDFTEVVFHCKSDPVDAMPNDGCKTAAKMSEHCRLNTGNGEDSDDSVGDEGVLISILG